MKSLCSKFFVTAAVVGLLVGLPSLTHAAVLYNATTSAAGTLTVENGVESYLQQFTLSGAKTSYTISSMVIGINYSSIAGGQQDVFMDFYTGLNLSPSATDALAGATYVTTEGVGLTTPAATGSYAFTITFNTPFTVPSNTFGIVFSLVDDASLNYSSELNPLFRLGGSPSAGSNPGFAWNDANEDGVFPGSEQTKFGNGTSANYYTSITATAAVPEPASILLFSLGGLGTLFVARKRRRSA